MASTWVSAGFALALGVSSAVAQDFPTRPIRLITPFPPGGTTDILARITAHKLTQAFGQQVIVDNRGGGGGTIGVEAAARATPDGYTILIAHIGPLSMAPALYPKLGYDPVKSFAPITLLATVPNGLVVHPSLPARSVKELIALARAKPKQVLYASAGSGSIAHLAVVNLEVLARIQLSHVPYKGGAPSVRELIAGETSLTITGMPQLRPHIDAARLRLLAIGESRRLPALPDVPTIAESGVPHYHVTQWQGILAPAGTPSELVAKLNAQIVKGIHSPDVKQRLTSDGAEPVGSTPQEFAAHIKSEAAKWLPIVRASGAKPD
ncbi:MAG TPA: tripartite tricarboxylate transporter substrate binding protein [Burkholderiales bacterium]|nr:tripartite tricarboxylate transporter substrate binding protein [Burkholderiales bacterium]